MIMARADRQPDLLPLLVWTEQAEIARLRKEVVKLKMERDILKKAAAWFAKESM